MAQATAADSYDRWGSLLSKLNPIPRFPEFTGPYKVGTVDIEIPVKELDSPAPAPEGAAEIETIQFRIFYPCDSSAHGKRITWLPSPQRDYLSAYIKFLGVGAVLAEAASFLPRHLHYTSIPVIDNAPILKPETPNGLWPTMIFSHGLGGSRHAYSQIVGSLASHGVVVFCPEHRDGSAILSLVRIPYQQNRLFKNNTQRFISYNRIPQHSTDEVYQRRNKQLRIRLWELGLLHEAILGINDGAKITNLSKHTAPLDHFADHLHVREPGSIIFAGHSFGAASIVQFLKSVYYAGRPELDAMSMPLYTPNWESTICRQITSKNVTILLDLWCHPLQAANTKPLFNLPLPAYCPSDTYSSASRSPGGNAILAVESEDFFKWRKQLHMTARVLSPEPSAQTVASTETCLPHFFYIQNSAHLNQSDFGVIFPWLTRKVFGTGAPGRASRLNLRAILQVLRVNGHSVAGTRNVDLVDTRVKDTAANSPESGTESSGKSDTCTDDTAIFEHEGNAIREDDTNTDELIKAWRWIDMVGMGQAPDSDDNEGKSKKKKGKKKEEVVEVADEQMENIVEPSADLYPQRQEGETASAPNISLAAA
ncbi:phospholipase A2 [Xylaria nigripes]|nr:phospholipase A2 [Xylaria nigripes]